MRHDQPPFAATADQVWLHRTPAEMATQALTTFATQFDWALDDLRALTSQWPVIAEGWGLRPGLVAPLLTAPDRMGATVSDPERAQQQRLARDRLMAADAVRTARAHGIRVIEVDGSQDAVAGLVAGHFRRYLPTPS
jgi:uncharacterized protein (DUF58 family)